MKLCGTNAGVGEAFGWAGSFYFSATGSFDSYTAIS